MSISETVSKIKSKHGERPKNHKAKILTKISCKIGNHYLYAYVNTGSSISIASDSLYRKLVEDNCVFREGIGTLNVIDATIPNENYRVTTTTVTVIGKAKSINLIAFPNRTINKTVLGIDFLSPKLTSERAKLNEIEKSMPLKLKQEQNPTNQQKQCEEKEDQNELVFWMDWIFNTSNLQTPLYNIFTEGKATDQDVYAICALMRATVKPVSPLKRLQKSQHKKSTDKNYSKESIQSEPLSIPSTVQPVVPNVGTTTTKESK